MRKKFIMILLSVVMVVSMLPATAFAADEATCFIAKGVAGKSQVAYSWTAVDGAAKYKVYQAKCGKKYKLIKTTKGTSLTTKGLTKKKKYKAYVVAVDANGDKIAKTPSVHNALKGGKYSNATRVSATENLLIGVGDSAQLEASITKADSKKTLLWERHISAQIRFISADKTVATVDATGKVSAVSAGSTYIYAIAASGASAACLVQVGLPIKIDRVAEQNSNIFDGVIPYASWQEAVARAWSFTATVDGKGAKFTAINYSTGKLGFEMSYADGQTQSSQKLGIFKASSPCYDWNVVANNEAVEKDHTYYLSGVWAYNPPAPKKETTGITIKEGNYFGLTGDFDVPGPMWGDAVDDDYVISLTFDATGQEIRVAGTDYDANEVVFSFDLKEDATTSEVYAELEKDNMVIKYDGGKEIVWGDERIDTASGGLNLEDPKIILAKMYLFDANGFSSVVKSSDSIQSGNTYYLSGGVSFIYDGQTYLINQPCGSWEDVIDDGMTLTLGGDTFQIQALSDKVYLYNNEEVFYLLTDDEDDSSKVEDDDDLDMGDEFYVKAGYAKVTFTDAREGSTFTLNGTSKSHPFSIIVPKGSSVEYDGVNYETSTVTIKYGTVTIATVVVNNSTGNGWEPYPFITTINSNVEIKAIQSSEESHDA